MKATTASENEMKMKVKGDLINNRPPAIVVEEEGLDEHAEVRLKSSSPSSALGSSSTSSTSTAAATWPLTKVSLLVIYLHIHRLKYETFNRPRGPGAQERGGRHTRSLITFLTPTSSAERASNLVRPNDHSFASCQHT